MSVSNGGTLAPPREEDGRVGFARWAIRRLQREYDEGRLLLSRDEAEMLGYAVSWSHPPNRGIS
jgi:hypothetical protein